MATLNPATIELKVADRVVFITTGAYMNVNYMFGIANQGPRGTLRFQRVDVEPTEHIGDAITTRRHLIPRWDAPLESYVIATRRGRGEAGEKYLKGFPRVSRNSDNYVPTLAGLYDPNFRYEHVSDSP